MKNLVLALLLALGVSTVANAATDEATLEQIVQDAEQANPGLVNWVKNNPVKFTAAVLATGAAVTYGVFVAKNYTKFDKDVEGTGFAAALKAPAVNSYNSIKDNAIKAKDGIKAGWDKSLNYTKEHKVIVAAGTVGAAILVAVLVDLMNKDGYIRTACDNATAEVANEVAAVEAN